MLSVQSIGILGEKQAIVSLPKEIEGRQIISVYTALVLNTKQLKIYKKIQLPLTGT